MPCLAAVDQIARAFQQQHVFADEQALAHLDAHSRVERERGVLIGLEDLG